MRIGIVGAGPAGLCSARHATAEGMSCTVFEQSDDLGGTWIYTDNVGKDKYGLPIHTSMYRNLRINFPKEIVKFPDYDYTNDKESYIKGTEVLKYLNNFAELHFLRKFIKFNTHVKKVSFKEGLWEVLILDLANNKEEVYTFDAIIICSGLNETPKFPKNLEMDKFLGKSMHSHDYRRPEPFRNKKVLVIGAGPSAMDTSNQIAAEAEQVFVSHHSDKMETCAFPKNVCLKPDVKEIKSNSAVFKDESEEKLDWIIYATGYKVTYPFLDSSCDILVDEKLVYPLYKHFVNARHPTMAILGNMGYSSQFLIFDIQVRFFLKTLLADILPTTDDMLKEVDNYIEDKYKNGYSKNKIFQTNSEEDKMYHKNLGTMANIHFIPDVYFKIHSQALEDIFTNFPNFRNNLYVIIDDENFVIKALLKL